MKRIRPTKPLLKPTARDLTTNRDKKRHPREKGVIITRKEPRNTSMKIFIAIKKNRIGEKTIPPCKEKE